MMHVHLAISKYKPYNSSTPFSDFTPFYSLEREAMKDERTHHGAMDNLNRNNRFVLVHQ